MGFLIFDFRFSICDFRTGVEIGMNEKLLLFNQKTTSIDVNMNSCYPRHTNRSEIQTWLTPMPLKFEWDIHKAATNLHKHGVSFEEAVSVFKDPVALIFDDEWHSGDEEREIMIGHSIRNRLLLVSFTELGDVVRVISARSVTNKERSDYEENAAFRFE